MRPAGSKAGVAMTDLSWDTATGGPVVVLATATACYAAYHYGSSAAAVRRLFGVSGDVAVRTAIGWWRRALGVLALGVVPFAVATLGLGHAPAALGLNADALGLSLALTAGLVALLAPLIALQARKPWFVAHYPEVREPVAWGPRDHARNAASWLAYLVGYELFFRGVLLFPLAAAFGPWPAIAISTFGYVLVHLPKNPGEGVGSLFIGVLYCAVALHTGSLVMPILAHWATAVAADGLAARARGRAAAAQSGPS